MKEMIKRTLRTFFEAAFGYVAANLAVAVADGAEDMDLLKTCIVGVLVSAIAAGIAAVINLPKRA